MAKKIEDVLAALERLQLAEYIRYVDDRRRLVRTHFLAGLARGMGMAVGFTILGAALVILLNRLAQRNLPIIGDFLADIVQIVQRRLE
ncbi:MAG: hypothetical protein IJ990_01070 [Alistipes sp.]|nr:hypothetical protein [Alistipes sp.]